MLLSARAAKLRLYPDYGRIEPFQGWTPDAPTESLGWYNAYNSVKHDREASLKYATLEHVIQAVVGVLVLAEAQFGARVLGRIDPGYLGSMVVMGHGAAGLFPVHRRYYPDATTQRWQVVPLPIAPTST